MQGNSISRLRAPGTLANKKKKRNVIRLEEEKSWLLLPAAAVLGSPPRIGYDIRRRKEWGFSLFFLASIGD
jgi:hypothetical protein